MGSLGTLAVGLAVLMLTLVVTFLVIAQGRTQAGDLVSTSSTVNETVTWTNNTFVALTNSPSAFELSCSNVYNNQTGPSANVSIGSGNYTCSLQGIRVTDVNTDAFNLTSTVQVTYTYKTKSFAYNATENLSGAIDDIPGWAPLIVVAVVGAILLGLTRLFGPNRA